MSRYTDEKNPHGFRKRNRKGASGKCTTCDGWNNGGCSRRPYVEPDPISCPACTFSPDLYNGYKEGYLAAEKELEFTDEERRVFRDIIFNIDWEFVADFVDVDIESALSLKKKVLGE